MRSSLISKGKDHDTFLLEGVVVVLILVKSKGFFDLSMLIFYDRGCTLFFRGRFFKIKGFFGKGLNLTFYFSRGLFIFREDFLFFAEITL